MKNKVFRLLLSLSFALLRQRREVVSRVRKGIASTSNRAQNATKSTQSVNLPVFHLLSSPSSGSREAPLRHRRNHTSPTMAANAHNKMLQT